MSVRACEQAVLYFMHAVGVYSVYKMSQPFAQAPTVEQPHFAGLGSAGRLRYQDDQYFCGRRLRNGERDAHPAPVAGARRTPPKKGHARPMKKLQSGMMHGHAAQRRRCCDWAR